MRLFLCFELLVYIEPNISDVMFSKLVIGYINVQSILNPLFLWQFQLTTLLKNLKVYFVVYSLSCQET